MRVKSLLSKSVLAAILFPMVLLAGCGGGNETSSAQSPETAESESADVIDDGASDAPKAAANAKPFRQKENLGDDNGRFQFTYSWPAVVSAIPALADRFESERKADYAKWRGEWDEANQDAEFADCVACRSRGFGKEWQVVTDLTRYLSLSAQVYTYSGGAHGMTVFDAIVWDREKEVAIKPVAMFRSPAALDAAVQDAFCTALDKARQRKRGVPVTRSGDTFNDCIAPVANSTIILGSAGGQRFDRVGFLIPPYNAGPYAEGEYEVTLNVTPAMLDAVRPEYRRAFLVR